MVDKVQKLETENQRLKNLVQHLEQKNENLESMLSKITSARGYKVWQSYSSIKKLIFNKLENVSNSEKIELVKGFIPIALRKKIKGRFQTKITSETKSAIGEDVLKSWKDWHDRRRPNQMDIINFGITPFDYRVQRPQHLALELAKKGYRIFYIETEFIPYAGKNQLTPIHVKASTHPNIFKITICASRNLFIYQDVPSFLDKKIMMNSLKTLLKEASIINPVAKIDHPFWGSLINEISMPVIYDCMDEHKGFKETGSEITKLENELFLKCDSLIVSSNYLLSQVKKYQKDKLLILKNAGEYEHFHRSYTENFQIPDKLKDINKPIIGYYGSIADWFDDKILEKLAKDNTKASIVLIGRVENNKVRRLAAKYSNIYLLGEKPYELLPNYLKYFDVCIIPFIINDLIKATSPVKVFEYLAAGKPVITTNMPELAELKEVVDITNTPEEFIEKVSQLLNESDKSIQNKRMIVSKKHTWEEAGNKLDIFIVKKRFPFVSIIILTYNKPEYTKKCIDSILNRSFYPNFELIISDNGSDKVTTNMLKNIKDPRVKLFLNNKNLGFAAGNNVGMKEASGEFLIILNNDTIVTPGWIERMVYHAQRNNIGLVGPVTNNIGNEQKVDTQYNPERIEEIERECLNYTSSHWGEVLELRNLAAFCWILSRNTYKKIGGFDERFGQALFEDDDYCMSVKKIGLKIICAEDVFIHHYGSITVKDIDEIEYKKLFNSNKDKFEKKWKLNWIPHVYRKK